MTTYTVYGDLLFLVNFCLDFVLLFAVSRFGNFQAPFWRLLLVAAASSLLSVAMVLSPLAFLNNFFCKILLSLAIVKGAFPKERGKKYLTAVAFFYLISFAMAGAVVGCTYLIRDLGFAEMDFTFTAFALSFSLLLCLLLSRWGMNFVKHNLRRNEFTEEIEIIIEGQRARIAALFDTGNELYDPVSHRPVIVTEWDAVREIMPESLRHVMEDEANGDVAAMMASLSDDPCFCRLRLIPFSSIGKSNGLLLGFKPEAVVLLRHDHRVVDDAVVGLYRGRLHTREDCRCIVNPAILDYT